MEGTDMANTPTPEQRIRQLISRGIMPSEAERIVADVDARIGRLMTPEESDRVAAVGADAIMQARQWWYYSPLVPTRFKRLLDAREVTPDAK
jgi:hypothetical protein